MQFLTTIVLFVGLSATYAAPASPQEDLQAELKKAVEPIEADVRSLIENAEVAAKDLTKSLSESGNNIVEAGRSLVAPVENLDRANVGGEVFQRAKNFGEQVKVNAKNLLDRINEDAEPIAENQKSVLRDMGQAVRMLEEKYLSNDAQEAVRMISRKVLPEN